MIQVDAHVAARQVLVGMQDHLEAMTMHTPTLVPRRDVRQAMRGLEAKSTPDMGMIACIQVHPFIGSALDADRIDNTDTIPKPAIAQPCQEPTRQIFIGRHLDQAIEVGIVQRSDHLPQCSAQCVHVTATVAGCLSGPNAGGKAMPVQAAAAMPDGQGRDTAGRIEPGRGDVMEAAIRHLVTY